MSFYTANIIFTFRVRVRVSFRVSVELYFGTGNLNYSISRTITSSRRLGLGSQLVRVRVWVRVWVRVRFMLIVTYPFVAI